MFCAIVSSFVKLIFCIFRSSGMIHAQANQVKIWTCLEFIFTQARKFSLKREDFCSSARNFSQV